MSPTQSVSFPSLPSFPFQQRHEVLEWTFARDWLCSLLLVLCLVALCQRVRIMRAWRNTALGPERGQPARCRHEYSVPHMALCIRICIHLKALIRTLDLKRGGCGCCQKSLLSLVSSFSLLCRSGEGLEEGEGGSPLEVDYLSVDWPVTKHWGAFIWEGERMSCHIMPRITELKALTLFKGACWCFFNSVSTVQVHLILSRHSNRSDQDLHFFFSPSFRKSIFALDEKQHPQSEVIKHSKHGKSLSVYPSFLST